MLIQTFSDYHIHLRQGDLLQKVIKHVYPRCSRILPMPNTDPPLTDGEMAKDYANLIKFYSPEIDVVSCIKWTNETTWETIFNAAKSGVKAIKIYPSGVTTNSGDLDIFSLIFKKDIFKAILDFGLVICVHGEAPNIVFWEAETRFIKIFEDLVSMSGCKFVLEHVTTEDAIEAVKRLNKDNPVAATITLHHLMLWANDVVSDKFYVHNYCKPFPKTKHDRECLLKAALYDNCFFLGSDSAPHEISNKECSNCCAGVYSSPVLFEAMVQLFDEQNSLDKLEDFASNRGDKFYGLPKIKKEVKLTNNQWKVPDEIESIKPFLANTMLKWQLASQN